MFDRCKLGRRSRVVVPDVVMNGLEVPKVFPCTRVQSEKRIGIEIVARAVSAVKLVLRRRDRKIRNPSLRIDGDFSPNIYSAHVLVSIFGPSVVSRFAGPRDRMEYPGELAGANVEGPNVARRREITLTGETANDDQIFENTSRSTGREWYARPIDARFQIQPAMIREAVDQISGSCVDGIHESTTVDKDSPIGMVLAFPVVGAPAANAP